MGGNCGIFSWPVNLANISEHCELCCKLKSFTGPEKTLVKWKLKRSWRNAGESLKWSCLVPKKLALCLQSTWWFLFLFFLIPHIHIHNLPVSPGTQLSPFLFACSFCGTLSILKYSSWGLYKEESRLLTRKYVPWIFAKRSVLQYTLKRTRFSERVRIIHSSSKNHSFELKGTTETTFRLTS